MPDKVHTTPAAASVQSVATPAPTTSTPESNSDACSALEGAGATDRTEGSWGRRGRGGASPLEPLATAVRAANVANANTAYNALGRGARAELRTHPILREYINLLPNADGLARLRAVSPSKALWLDIANTAFAGVNADLTTALRDNKITGGKQIVSNIAGISRLANLRTTAVLQPIVNGAADAGNHGAVLNNPTAVALLQGAGTPFTVLTGLDHAQTRSAYVAVEAARTWLNTDLPTLGTKVSGWGAKSVNSWVDLHIQLGNLAQTETWYDAGVAAWQPPLLSLFSTKPSSTIKSTFVAGQTLAVKVIDAAGVASGETGAKTCQSLGWQPTQGFERAIAGNWLNAAASSVLAGSDTAMMEMLACTASIQAGLAAKNIYITDAFPKLSKEAIARLYQSNVSFKAAIESNAERYAGLHATIPSIAPPAAVMQGPVAMPAVDPANPTPLDALRTATLAGNGVDALNAFDGLSRRDRKPLKSDPMLQLLVTLVGGASGERILNTVKPKRFTWLQIAAFAFAGDAAALARTLAANKINSSKKLAQRANDLIAFPVYHTAALLQPLLADGKAGGHGACLASPSAVAMLNMAFPGQHAFQVLTALNSKITITGYKAHLGAQTWLESNVGELANKIVAWRSVTKWIDAALSIGKPALVQQLYDTNHATWLPLLQVAFAKPSGLVKATFLPTNALAQTLIDSMGKADAARGVKVAQSLGWTPVQILERAVAGAWFSQATLNAAMPADAAVQETIANHAGILAAVSGLPLHPTVAFPKLAANSNKMAQIFRTNAVFQQAMANPPATFEAYLATQKNLGPWVEAMLAANQAVRLLELAQANPRAWHNGVNSSPGGIDSVLAALPAAGVPNNNAYQGLYAIFGKASSRSLAQNLTMFERITAVDILPPGDRSVRYHKQNVVDGANQWSLREQFIGMAPTLAAMSQLMVGMAKMPLSAAQQTQRLMFQNLHEVQWQQTGLAAGAGWHNFATPQMRDYGTSFAHNGLVALRCDGRGGPIKDRIGKTSDGAATTFGGPKTVARTRDQLSLFQNHAVHEFGHNVGAASYPRAAGGAPLRGDADAETWGSWRPDTVAALRASYWGAPANDSWRVPDGLGGRVNVPVAANDVFTYLQTLMYTNNTPGAGNDVTDNTVSRNDAWRRISGSRNFRGTNMVKYMKACGGANYDRDNAFQFPGFTPPDPVHIFSTRWANQGATYSKATYTTLHKNVGWYSLASPQEAFAELYAKYYSGQGAVDAYWRTWFGELDRSPAATANAGPGLHPGAGAAVAPVAGEVEPPLWLMRGVL